MHHNMQLISFQLLHGETGRWGWLGGEELPDLCDGWKPVRIPIPQIFRSLPSKQHQPERQNDTAYTMVDSDSDPDQYDDFADDALEPYSNVSSEVDLETRLKAVKKEITEKGRFANDGEVLDFLDRHAEIADKCVTKGGGNLLHRVVEVVHHNDVNPSHVELLVRQLVKRWPRLLADVNRDRQNPILMATRLRESRLVDYMISACNDSDHLERALGEKAQEGKTCLHAVFQAPLRLSTIGRLIERASDDLLAVQDDRGRTPMHLAVSYSGLCSDPGTKLMALFMDRDLKVPRNDPRRQESFLDLRTTSGRSVYKELERTRASMVKKYEACQAAQRLEADNQEKAEGTRSPEIEETKRVDAPARNGYAGERDSVMPAPQALRAGHETSQHEPAPNTSLKRQATARFEVNPDQERGAEKVWMTSAATKSRDKPDPIVFLPGRIKNATATLQRLKLQYMRSRSAEMTISFLYGNNIDGQYRLPAPFNV